MKKVKLFSHTDLDGYGCNLIMKILFDNEADCENLNYDTVNERILKFINNEEYKEYELIYITDISVNEEVAKVIDDKVNNEKLNIMLLDHHPTALYLNKHEWATVEIERNGEKTSGTRMVYDFCEEAIKIIANDGIINKNDFFNLIENIRKYDTWLWKEKYNDIKPKQINDLFYLLGADRFIDNLLRGVRVTINVVDNFIEDNKLLLELQQEKIDKYIDKKNKEIIQYNINNYNVGVVFAEQFQSELGNRLSEMNPQYDLIAMIGDKTISYRTVKDNVNCGEIAKLFGGGGHPKASGSQISESNKLKYLDILFNKSC